MFILVNFGYKLQKVFTINCLGATLFDCIWTTCYKELLKLYTTKQEQFAKQIVAHQKKIEKNEKRLEEVEAKLKEQAAANPDKKPEKPTAKKGGKDQPVAGSPLEQEKMDLTKEIEDSKNAITKYNDKLAKIPDLITKANALNDKITKQQSFVELVDKTGERKFVKSKAQSIASTFLSDKGTYYLCVLSLNGEEQVVEPFVIDGYPVRLHEEDAGAVGEEVFSLTKKEDPKKGAKKK